MPGSYFLPPSPERSSRKDNVIPVLGRRGRRAPAGDEALARRLAHGDSGGVFFDPLTQAWDKRLAAKKSRKEPVRKKMEVEQEVHAHAIANFVRDLATLHGPADGGARFKKYPSPLPLTAALKLCRLWKKRKVAAVDIIDADTVAVEFRCGAQVAAAFDKDLDWFARFSVVPAPERLPQPVSKLLVTQKYPLRLVFSCTSTLEFLPLAGKEPATHDCYCDACAPLLQVPEPAKKKRGRPRDKPLARFGVACCVQGCAQQKTLRCNFTDKDWCRKHWVSARLVTNCGRKTRTVIKDRVSVRLNFHNPSVFHVAQVSRGHAPSPAPASPPAAAAPAPPSAAGALAAVGEVEHGEMAEEDHDCAVCGALGVPVLTLWDAFDARWLCSRHFKLVQK